MKPEISNYYKQKYKWLQFITLGFFILACFDFAVLQTVWLGILSFVAFVLMALMGYVKPNKITKDKLE